MTDPLPFADEAGRPTLRTVAEMAGVHISTVSRVLAPSLRPGVRAASKATTERIKSIAAELGYSPNPIAAGLRTSRSSLVGVLVPRLTDIVLATIYEGIHEAARGHGYQTFVANSEDREQEREAGAEMLLARRVDGLILGDCTLDPTFADSLQQRGVPFVLVSRRSGNHPAVVGDDHAGGRIAAEHLLSLGHTDVGIIAGEPYASTGVDRTSGFLAAYAEAGITIPASRIVHSSFDVIGGREASTRIFANKPWPTALFAVNDFAAIGTFGTLRGLGLRAGEDIAVVGYNDTVLAAELPVPLTSVHSPMREMGELAFELLLSRLNGEPVASRVLRPHLVVRESSAGARWDSYSGASFPG
jgi:LacI family transcriptional regulator